MALPSFVEHLRVLEDSGLVRSRKVGRVRTYELAPKRLKLAEDWLSRNSAASGSAGSISSTTILLELKEKSSMTSPVIKPDPKLDLVLERDHRRAASNSSGRPGPRPST